MEEKTRVFVIHGGNTFRTEADYVLFLKTRSISVPTKPKWYSDWFKSALGEKFVLILPRMPLQDNAKYAEWKIHFERFFPYLKDGIILIGSSLGGIFLAKYLSENKFPKRILSTYLICQPFDNTIPSEELVGGFKLKSDLSLLEQNAGKLTLLFSKNDDVVPVTHAKKYRKKLENAKIMVYNHVPGHFLITEFPEIVKMIKADVKRT